jgi:ubiquinone/menaquinone biosynthesis C-methylase UbiE
MANQTWLEWVEATRLYQRLRYSMNYKLVDFFRKKVFVGRTGLRLAEVACGSGFAAHLLAQEPGISLSIAGDINLEDFRQAEIKDFKASFVLMDLFRPAAAAGSMDLVWNSSSIEEIDRPEEAVAAMAWLAKSGGYVFVGVPYRRGLAGLLRVVPNRRMRAWLGRVYDEASLGSLLTTAGLQIEAQTTYLGRTFIGMLGRKPNKV